MFNSYFDITRGYIPLKSPFCWLNPIKPPLNHHFPMGFLRFSTIFTTSELHRTFVASDLQQPGLHPISRAPAGGQAPVLARATAEPHRDHGPKAAAEVEAASFLHIIYYVYIYMKNIYIYILYIYISGWKANVTRQKWRFKQQKLAKSGGSLSKKMKSDWTSPARFGGKTKIEDPQEQTFQGKCL